jgi:hypothetical protein
MRDSLGPKNLGLFAVFALVALGCVSLRPYDPGPGKRVAADFVQETYLSGQPINITISNLSEVTLYYPDGFCNTELQRKDGATWKTISQPSVRCSSTLDFLDPGQTVVHQYHLPKGVAVGTYRLAMPMPVAEEVTAPEPALQTPAFTVYASAD